LKQAKVGSVDRSEIDNNNGISREIEFEIPHDEHNEYTGENDVMLLLLKEPVLNHPLALLQKSEVTFTPKQSLTAIGYGITKSTANPDNLQQVELEYVSREVCKEASDGDSSYQGLIYDDMLCAHYSGSPKDTCGGDSGGPLLLLQDGSLMNQVGLVAWGKECGSTFFPGVFTSVGYHYESFIRPWVCRLDSDLAPTDFDCAALTLDEYNHPISRFPIPSGKIRLWVVLYMDCWPDEISWEVYTGEVYNGNDETIISSRGYDEYSDYQDTVVKHVDLNPSTVYTFSIYDYYEDGIDDDGSYELWIGGQALEEADERIVQERGDFGIGKNHTFTTPAASPSSSPTTSTDSSPVSIDTNKNESSNASTFGSTFGSFTSFFYYSCYFMVAISATLV
jgi:hypothetical protein